MFEVKHGPKCSAGLGPICCTTMIKKKNPSKFLLCDICVKMLGFKWQFMVNFVSVLFLSSLHFETTLSGIRGKNVGLQWCKQCLLFEKNPWGTTPSFRWQKRDTAVGMSTVGRGEIKEEIICSVPVKPWVGTAPWSQWSSITKLKVFLLPTGGKRRNKEIFHLWGAVFSFTLSALYYESFILVSLCHFFYKVKVSVKMTPGSKFYIFWTNTVWLTGFFLSPTQPNH